jgi:mono/diheme cytochrome c family protein
MMRAAFVIAGLMLLAGCERAKQDMYDQPRYKPFAASKLFENGTSARAPVEGTQPRARGAFAASSGGQRGTEAVETDIAAERAQTNPYPVDLALLQRGQERYTIYCMPCHSPAGDGDGLVVRRGFPPPPTYHQDRLRTAPDRHIYDVIKNGYGVMVSYGDRVEPADRWAIVAYVRALQLSQHADAAALPADVRVKLADAGRGGAMPDAAQDAAGAIAQPNQRYASPPEKVALPMPPGGMPDATPARPGLSPSDATPLPPSAGAVTDNTDPHAPLVAPSERGHTAPFLAPALRSQLRPLPRNAPGPQTGDVPPQEKQR